MYPFLQFYNRAIPMYGICMAVGIAVVVILSSIYAQRRGLCFDDLIIYAACILAGCISGAKLLYVMITYGLTESIHMIINGQGHILVEEGGFVFYGGLIGGICAICLGKKISGVNPALFCTCVVPFIPLGHAFGRLGCFFAGCCYGMPHELLGVCFPHSLSHLPPDIAVIPTQLIEVCGNLLIFAFLFRRYIHEYQPSWHPLCDYVLLYSIERFFIEFLRGDSMRGCFLFFSTSQWISLLLLPAALLIKRKLKTHEANSQHKQ